MELELTKDEIKGKKFYQGKGCNRCRNIGYKGRMGIFEMMVMNEELRRLVIEGASTNIIRIAAKKAGMNTLRDGGLSAIYNGLTTIHEVVRETILA